MLAYLSIEKIRYVIILGDSDDVYASMITYMMFYISLNLVTFSCIALFGLNTETDNIWDYAWTYMYNEQEEITTLSYTFDTNMYVRNVARKFHCSKTPCLLLKTDIKKILVSVRWSYLMDLLRHYCFPPPFCEWVGRSSPLPHHDFFLMGYHVWAYKAWEGAPARRPAVTAQNWYPKIWAKISLFALHCIMAYLFKLLKVE